MIDVTDEMVEAAAKAAFCCMHALMHDHDRLWRECLQQNVWRDCARAALAAALARKPVGEEPDPSCGCVFCDINLELHEDERGFHHVGKRGQRASCTRNDNITIRAPK